MFGGVTYLTLDTKNRISIPAKYRVELQEVFNSQIVLTLESSQCVLLYPEAHWASIKEKILNLATGSHPLVKSYQRLVLGYAESMEIDKVGRVLVPSSLRKLAQLEREVVLVGLGNRFEIWDSIKWEAETNKALGIAQEELANLLNDLYL